MVEWETMSHYTRLFESLSKATRHDNPREYFTFGQSLSPQLIEEIANANINRDGVLHDGTRSGYKEGVEKQNHKLREYITKENADKYPALTEFIKEISIFLEIGGKVILAYPQTKVWLDKKICQINLSLTRNKGTIRGLHYQEKPYQESKLIRCL